MLCSYDAIGISPFAVDSIPDAGESELSRTYVFIDQMTLLILKHQGNQEIIGFILNKEKPSLIKEIGEYELEISLDSIFGFNAEEGKTFPDNSAAFVNAANSALGFSTRSGVKILSPTLEMTKAGIARKFMELKIDPGSFWCCYEGGDKLCGRCESCTRTIRAFKEAGALEDIRNRFA